MNHRRVAGVLIAVAALWSAAPGRAQSGDAPDESQFRFRFVGPKIGNRIAAAAGVPGDPRIYYAGAASGGIWKSTDGGNLWSPVFDKQSVAAIGALAVAPSDPAVVWAGTGEAWVIRDSDVMGDGIYKSTDAGRTWRNMGLRESGRIGRIVVHPTNPDIVYACVLGRTTGPQQDKGVYRTLDGGQHWERVLFARENVGCSGLAIDPHNPRTLIAGLWQVEMHTWGEYGGGPGSGVYLSHDGGTTWTRLEGRGLPHAPLGKIDVAVAPSNSDRLYALIQTQDQGSLWRSDDGGEHWKAASRQRSLIGRAGYYIRVAVSPGNDNEVLVANSTFHQSLDGGENFQETRWGGDTHDIWIDPRDPDRFVITDDLGLLITTVHGRGFHRVTLPIGQMYHVAVDNQVPYYFYSNMQDDGNLRGPAVSAGPGESGWDRHMGGCESGFTVPDTVDPNVVWATCYGDTVTRWDARHHEAHSVSPWMHTLDAPPGGLKYRCHWTPPLAIDPFDHNTVYYGCQVVLRTTDAGQSWSVVSPDLSTQDPAHLAPSGGIVGDNLGQFYGEVVFAIAPSRVQRGVIWAGTNDGQVWVTRDATANWTNVTRNMGGLPPLGTITSIAPSSFEPGTAYVSVDLHLVDNRDPFIYKTTDFGRSWRRISGNLPRHAFSYVRCITDDPNARGLLFAGTGNGVYYSTDDGEHWTALQTGLPPAPATWAVVQPTFHDLVVSTYGRGLYILDDISPLEQLAQDGSEPPVRFFEPRTTYRFVRAPQALINFSLKTAPKDPVRLEVLDAQGHPVRRLEAKGTPGLNRIRWDLRHEPPRLVALRTRAPDNPHIWNEPRFRDADSRPITHWGTRPAEVGPLVAPGAYTVRLTVDGQSYSQRLVILRDPAAPGSDDDIAQSVDTQLRIRDQISHSADVVNQIEWLRRQLEVIDGMAKPSQSAAAASAPRAEEDDDDDDESAPAATGAGAASTRPLASLAAAAAALDGRLAALETRYVSRALRNSDDKYFVEPYGLYLNLLWLNAEVGTGAGDVAGGADFAPTRTQLELLRSFEAESTELDHAFRQVLDEDVPAFNGALAQAHVAALPVTPLPH
ncbi:MAG: sialidase [Proteobacteria bacterium]|nr:sialidase [Pseudomonadota bacterium]